MGIKRQSLGKGLDALMGDYVDLQDDQQDGFKERVNADREIRDIPIEFLKRGKYQPRKDYNSKALDELALSIGEQGIVQPIIIREVQPGAYEIVAGERRWLAAQRAGLETVPAIVREIDDRTAIAMALIENIQRENLNPMEESEALIRLQNEFHLTQQEIADTVGKSRSTVTNLMRLANLEPFVQNYLIRRAIDIGHAKCLLGLAGKQQIDTASIVVDGELSVRQTEVLVKRLQKKTSKPAKKEIVQPDLERLQQDISDRIGADVKIQHSSTGRGKLIFRYNSLDELDGILARVK